MPGRFCHGLGGPRFGGGAAGPQLLVTAACAKPLAFRVRAGGGPVGVVGPRNSGPSLEGDAKMGSSGLSSSTLKLASGPIACGNRCKSGSGECVVV